MRRFTLLIMTQQSPLLFGCVGLGGYGAVASDTVLREQQRPGGVARLVSACDPDLPHHAKRAEELRAQGVAVSNSFDELLAGDCQAVWLPVPIPLHRPFMEKALAAGKAVLCEKPAAGCIDDLDAMIAARDRAALPAAIGFQNIYQPSMQEAKRRLLEGAIGKITAATVTACWPRDSHYYGRNNWAGALQRDGAWVLDSPANNAMAHFINLALFLLGPDERHTAQPQRLEAELYRANEIENYDTCSLRIATAGEVPLLVLMTHACEKLVGPIVEITGTKGTLRFQHDGFELIRGGAVEPIGERGMDLGHVVRGFVDYARDGSAIVATLELARAHTLVISGASQATAVQTIPASFVHTIQHPNGATLRFVPEIDHLFADCAREKKMLHESGRLPWSAPSRSINLTGYHHFAGPPAV
jgi:predicted dehydrogenase